MAPEFLRGGTITPKSDIFSLGVIMMEIITGHRDYPYVAGTSSDDFVKLVRKFPFTFKDGGPETMQHFTFAF
jgi:serine/threonine protein kinase